MIKEILKFTQDELRNKISTELNKYYKEVITTTEYVAARGEIPIVLVAHLDTVFDERTRHNMLIVEDKEKGILWSPEGLGTDDRAGVAMILTSLEKTNLRPHILFTTDEETLATGAMAVASLEMKEKLFGKVSYLIELDRQGYKESVFYNCNNPKFEKFINSFGFETEVGTFTDISIICPKWKIAGVNLSVGYYYEHSFIEHFYLGAWIDTLHKVIKMLKINNNQIWKYIPKEYKKE